MLAMNKARTIAIKLPVHVGIQPIKVKRIIDSIAPMVVLYWAFLPLVAIRIARTITMVILRLRKVPASVVVISRAVLAAVSQSDHIAISISK